MTVIVAVRKGDQVCIAADTQSTQGSLIASGDNCVAPRKIHRVNDSYVGISGVMAHHLVFRSLIRHHAERLCFDSVDDIFESLRRVHPVLKDDYFTMTGEDDKEQEYESSQFGGLICNAHGAFHFESNRNVSEVRKYWSVGSGSEIALGALYAAYPQFDDARHIAELAVKAACALDDGCGLPLQSHQVSLAANTATDNMT